jgi:1-acylglycerone phosphate reductase
MDIDINKVRKIFEVNVFAMMQMCEAFSRLLIARKGVIVQIGSVTRDGYVKVRTMPPKQH